MAHEDGSDPVERILSFLSQFVSLDDTQRRTIRAVTRIVRYPRGTIVLAEGSPATESWLVVDGCVRAFRDVGGADRTIEFYTELHPAIPPTYGTDAPSPVSFECLEDVVASASTPAEEARAFAEHPAFDAICRVMGEVLVARLQQVHIDALTRTAEERYLDLVARRPDLLQRVPQYHIASFLGVQPETLSRIRRRLTRRGASR